MIVKLHLSNHLGAVQTTKRWRVVGVSPDNYVHRICHLYTSLSGRNGVRARARAAAGTQEKAPAASAPIQPQQHRRLLFSESPGLYRAGKAVTVEDSDIVDAPGSTGPAEDPLVESQRAAVSSKGSTSQRTPGQGRRSTVKQPPLSDDASERRQSSASEAATTSGRASGDDSEQDVPTELIVRLVRHGDGWGEEIFPHIEVENRPLMAKKPIKRNRSSRPDPWQVRSPK